MAIEYLMQVNHQLITHLQQIGFKDMNAFMPSSSTRVSLQYQKANNQKMTVCATLYYNLEDENFRAHIRFDERISKLNSHGQMYEQKFSFMESDLEQLNNHVREIVKRAKYFAR